MSNKNVRGFNKQLVPIVRLDKFCYESVKLTFII